MAEASLFTRTFGMRPRQFLHQVMNLVAIAMSALMIWKGLMVVTSSESPVVVVLSGSMEPAFYRGDLLFLYLVCLGGERGEERGETVVAGFDVADRLGETVGTGSLWAVVVCCVLLLLLLLLINPPFPPFPPPGRDAVYAWRHYCVQA